MSYAIYNMQLVLKSRGIPKEPNQNFVSFIEKKAFLTRTASL